MDPVLKKLFFKGQAPVLVLNPPPEAEALPAALDQDWSALRFKW